MFRLIPQQCRLGGGETEAGGAQGSPEGRVGGNAGSRARTERRGDGGTASSQLHLPQHRGRSQPPGPLNLRPCDRRVPDAAENLTQKYFYIRRCSSFPESARPCLVGEAEEDTLVTKQKVPRCPEIGGIGSSHGPSASQAPHSVLRVFRGKIHITQNQPLKRE